MHTPARLRPKRLHGNAAGVAPGTLQPHAEAKETRVTLLRYDGEGVTEAVEPDLVKVREGLGHGVIWLDVQGMADTRRIQELAGLFGLHPLAVEDAVTSHQRAKAEAYPEHLFVVVRQPDGDDPANTEQVSLFLGAHYVITFQEHAGDCLDPVRERIRGAAGRIRKRGPDYLAYAILDAVVDSYFPWVETNDAHLAEIEDEVLAGTANHGVIDTLARLRRRFARLRRLLAGLNDCLEDLREAEASLVGAETKVYLRDALDHLRRMIDQVEHDRETAAGLLDYHISRVNHEMNDVMKVLTVMSTVFIPLSFLAGLWGMNFASMPELQTPWGYPVALTLMAGVAAWLLRWFRRRRWI
ncbi:MAG: magnesium/cobalt transporter CorA [Myxococcales bacterium]|nr:magnesium/cobalt transporter CorA [Myxococcales bacterium]